MSSQLSLSGLQQELLRRRLPLEYVRRVVGELEDHHSELREAGAGDDLAASAEARLGDARQLADQIATEYQDGSLAGRRPIVSFVVAPLPLVLGCWLAYFLLAFCLAAPLVEFVGSASPVMRGLLVALHEVGIYLPPLVAMWLLLRAWRRSARRLPWLCIACGLVALAAGAFQSSLVFSSTPGDSKFSVGFGSGMQWPLILPVLLTCLLLWRNGRPARTEVA